jgi:hypothetical protein
MRVDWSSFIPTKCAASGPSAPPSVAFQTEQAFYHASRPGLAWVTRADATSLVTRSDLLGYELDVKLTHPSGTDAFYQQRRLQRDQQRTHRLLDLQSWQAIRN